MISALKRLVTSNEDKTNQQPNDNSNITNLTSTNNSNQSNTRTNSPKNENQIVSVQQSINNNANGSRNSFSAAAHTTSSLINNGMHMISESLQKKFARGVNYNSNFLNKNCYFFFYEYK